MAWLVAQTESQREHVADRWLTRDGFTVYCPRILVRQATRGRIIDRETPLFPSYVLVASTPRWFAIPRTIGVVDLLRSGERPAELGEDVIARIRKQERDGLVALPKPPRLKRGDAIRVVHGGSFFGALGVYDGAAPHQRERALLALLGGLVAVEFPAGSLEAVVK